MTLAAPSGGTFKPHAVALRHRGTECKRERLEPVRHLHSVDAGRRAGATTTAGW